MSKMKLLIITILSALTLSACVSDSKAPSSELAATENSVVDNSATIADQKAEDGSYAAAVIPNTNNPNVQLLIQSPYWVAEHWVNHADNSQNLPNKGRWWQLKADGTFVCGQWQETYSYGSWVVYNNGEKELLLFDAVNDNLDMEFEIQGLSQLKDYMSWAGTGTHDMKRIAVKATSLLSMPTKAQFGL